jgi:tetratricopeptide (TPR) repeat protein
VDPKKIINESNGLLKEREPELTAEEYPIYEKLSGMVATQPDLAVTVLEGMMGDKELPSPAFELILGNAYFTAGQKDKAEVRYLSAVKRYPTFLRAWDNLGVLYYTLDRCPQAITCFTKALTLGDRDPSTYGLLGYCLEHTGSLVASEMAYIQAIAEDPQNADWMSGLLRIYVQRKEYGQAEALAKELIEIHPSEHDLWLTEANILINEDKKLEAMVVLEASAGVGVANAEELNLLADIYAEQGFEPEAASTYRRVMAVAPAMGERKLIRFAQSLIATGKLDEASAVLDGVPASLSHASNIAFLQARSDIFAARRNWSEARNEIQKLLVLEPLNGRALLSLGYAYIGLKDWAQASFAFSAALAVPDAAYRASFELANIELKNRHFDKCVEYLEKALSIERTDELEDYAARVKALLDK